MASILRHRRKRYYTVLPNETLRDEHLSFRATGLLAYLLSMKDGSTVDSASLSKQKPEGRDAIRTAFGELVKAGYVSRRKEQSPATGQWSTVMEITDIPDAGLSGVGPAPDFQEPPTPDRPTSDFQAVNEKYEVQVTTPPTPLGGSGHRRGLPIPEPFVIDDEMRDWAQRKVRGLDIDAETEVFVDYWRSRGRPMKDWVAAWRNWMRRSHSGEQGPPLPGLRRPPPPHPPCDDCESTGWTDTAAGMVRCPACNPGPLKAVGA